MNTRISLTRTQILRLLDGYPIQMPTDVGLLEFEACPDSTWQPLQRMVDISAIVDLHDKVGTPAPDEVWFNETYDVFVKHGEGLTHLSIKRMDRAPIRNWRHLQQIKDEICGPEREGAELFPAESRLADNANQYHMFVLPAGISMPFGFPSGMVLLDPEEVGTYNRNGDKGRQEPLQPGLTVGAAMSAAQLVQGALRPEDENVRQRILNGGLR